MTADDRIAVMTVLRRYGIRDFDAHLAVDDLSLTRGVPQTDDARRAMASYLLIYRSLRDGR